MKSLYWCALALPALVVPVACGDDESSDGTGDGGTGGAASPDGGTETGGSGGNGGGTGGDSGSGGEASMPDGGADGGGECSAGCSCDLHQVCDYTCAGGCTVECLGGLCTADCAAGGCTLDADFGASVTYTCEGGDCAFDCDNESTCAIGCEGGGCMVECDGGSTCSVECPEDGTACNVHCANGGRAICDGNCSLEGCDASCEPDPSYDPMLDPNDFTNVVDNPLFPFAVGTKLTYTGLDETITITVTDQAKTVMGIDAVVVHDEVRSPEGDLIEDTYDWYAQDADGNVWYLGEETAEYVNGMVATTAGSWEAGVDGALPGIIMQASPTVGQIYRQEYYACEAEDMGEVVEVDVSISVGGTDYTGCVNIRDFTPLDSASNEIKTFCPGVGVVRVEDVASGVITEELSSVEMP